MKFRIEPRGDATYALMVSVTLASGSRFWQTIEKSPDIRYLRGAAQRYKIAEEATEMWLSQKPEEFEL